MTDHHTHIGQFYDIYTSPLELVQVMDAVGVEHFASSSTTICKGDYGKMLAEMSELVCIAENRVLPVLWIFTANVVGWWFTTVLGQRNTMEDVENPSAIASIVVALWWSEFAESDTISQTVAITSTDSHGRVRGLLSFVI